MVTYTTSVTSEHAQTMSFVYVNAGIVFFLQANDFRQIRQITFHREYAVYNNELQSIRFAFLQLLLQRIHVIMLVFQLSSERETATVNDRSMITVIANNVVSTSDQLGNNSFVYCKTGRKTQRFIFSNELSQFLFQFNVNVQCSVQQS